jgi:cytoskeletal protein RodZ
MLFILTQLMYNCSMKNLQNKNLAVIVAVVLMLGVGVFAAIKNQKSPNKTESQKSESQQNQAVNSEGKTDTPPDVKEDPVQTTPNSTPTKVPTAGAGVVSDVTLTVYLNNQATTSQDGKTTIPAGSLLPYFYVPSGIYSIQKLSSATWVDVASNINYPGHGGISAQQAGPAEDNISYRVLRLEGGVVKDVSKTFVVKRSDLQGGFKTYN